MHILSPTKLKNEIDSQNFIVQESLCNICRVTSTCNTIQILLHLTEYVLMCEYMMPNYNMGLKNAKTYMYMQGVDYSTKQNARFDTKKTIHYIYFIYSKLCILRDKLYSTAEELNKYY